MPLLLDMILRWRFSFFEDYDRQNPNVVSARHLTSEGNPYPLHLEAGITLNGWVMTNHPPKFEYTVQINTSTVILDSVYLHQYLPHWQRYMFWMLTSELLHHSTMSKKSFKANQFPASREESISIWSEPDLGVFFAIFCSDKDILAEVIFGTRKNI